MTSSLWTAFVTGLHRSVLLAALSLMHVTLMARDWVNLDGTHLEADLVSEEAGMLVLRSGNALPFRVPLQQFSDSDWLHVWNWMHTKAMQTASKQYPRPSIRSYSKRGTAGGGVAGISSNTFTNTTTVYVTPSHDANLLHGMIEMPIYFNSSALEIRCLDWTGDRITNKKLQREQLEDAQAGRRDKVPPLQRESYLSFAVRLRELVALTGKPIPPNETPQASDMATAQGLISTLGKSQVMLFWQAQIKHSMKYEKLEKLSPEAANLAKAAYNFRYPRGLEDWSYWVPQPDLDLFASTLSQLEAAGKMAPLLATVGDSGMTAEKRTTAWKELRSIASSLLKPLSEWTSSSHLWYYPIEKLSMMNKMGGEQDRHVYYFEVIQGGRVISSETVR